MTYTTNWLTRRQTNIVEMAIAILCYRWEMFIRIEGTTFEAAIPKQLLQLIAIISIICENFFLIFIFV